MTLTDFIKSKTESPQPLFDEILIMATPLPPATRILQAFISPELDPPGTVGVNGNTLPQAVYRHSGPYYQLGGVPFILPYDANILPNSVCVIKLQWVLFANGASYPAPQRVVILPAIILLNAGPTQVDIPYDDRRANIEGLTIDPVIKMTADISMNGRVYGYVRPRYFALLP
jgi:hypothetical protein